MVINYKLVLRVLSPIDRISYI